MGPKGRSIKKAQHLKCLKEAADATHLVAKGVVQEESKLNTLKCKLDILNSECTILSDKLFAKQCQADQLLRMTFDMDSIINQLKKKN